MTKKLCDLIRQTTETEGVSDIALIDPEQGYFGFVDVLGEAVPVAPFASVTASCTLNIPHA